jgi:hypothetical protein
MQVKYNFVPPEIPSQTTYFPRDRISNSADTLRDVRVSAEIERELRPSLNVVPETCRLASSEIDRLDRQSPHRLSPHC